MRSSRRGCRPSACLSPARLQPTANGLPHWYGDCTNSVGSRIAPSRSSGEEIDVARHALLCSTLRRLAQRIGINRRLKNVTLDLHDYLEATNRTDDDVGVPR